MQSTIRAFFWGGVVLFVFFCLLCLYALLTGGFSIEFYIQTPITLSNFVLWSVLMFVSGGIIGYLLLAVYQNGKLAGVMMARTGDSGRNHGKTDTGDDSIECEPTECPRCNMILSSLTGEYRCPHCGSHQEKLENQMAWEQSVSAGSQQITGQ